MVDDEKMDKWYEDHKPRLTFFHDLHGIANFSFLKEGTNIERMDFALDRHHCLITGDYGIAVYKAKRFNSLHNMATKTFDDFAGCIALFDSEGGGEKAKFKYDSEKVADWFIENIKDQYDDEEGEERLKEFNEVMEEIREEILETDSIYELERVLYRDIQEKLSDNHIDQDAWEWLPYYWHALDYADQIYYFYYAIKKCWEKFKGEDSWIIGDKEYSEDRKSMSMENNRSRLGVG